MQIKLKKLVHDVFSIKENETIMILYDLPVKEDSDEWEKRRKITHDWHRILKDDFETMLVNYNATGSNNADFPQFMYTEDKKFSTDEIMAKADIVIALTQFSATAPLHKYGKAHGLRAASMPQFNKKMLSALNLDYNDVSSKVDIIYDYLEKAKSARIIFHVNDKEYVLFIDLRNRKPRKDNGICHEKGKVINLPSGEAFIVPYEGKKSKTQGFLPIQLNNEVSVYGVSNNSIIFSSSENYLIEKIRKDPAIGNIAELAFGVLGLYGIKSSGKVLLDEKLGMHIALGRSEHLGGKTNPDSFKNLKNVWHQDFVYIKEMQPAISVKKVKLILKDNSEKMLIQDDKYVVFE